MKLIGSSTSPYVRRSRLLLADTPFEFVDLNIYAEGRDALRKANPALKIPLLQDGEQTIYDSRIISRYISSKLGLPALSWDEENQITLVESVNDSLILLFQAGNRSGLDIRQDVLVFNLQHERIASTLSELERQVVAGKFASWNYPAICLLCMLDWTRFREVADLSPYPALLSFVEQAYQRADVQATSPR
ncbi:glutathione S-transferase [Pokkaliibacter plantistimulans]|uniref:Glutathione S-transferase n=1 Tax=Pokkaliibacter plantistimulans TaxID=1635171 RepID=A0ABX5LTK1_9GAMM|nr:glutathione S-transferase N-terminal domain-containing protein [Pokkaliibacter plantistimulans]PXF28611.1 glutathione S-transferase [Pokkaliibacter plantistimulans]